VHRHDLTEPASAENGIVRGVAEIVIHPNYIPLRYNRDVALWRLDEPIYDIPLLPLDVDGDHEANGTMLTVIGWGATREGGSGSDVLLEVDVPVVDQATCNDNYNGGITEFMICAGYEEGGKDACQGDSGGPLFYQGADGPLQVGIVSWGSGCARPELPGVYTRISSVADWILDTIHGRRK